MTRTMIALIVGSLGIGLSAWTSPAAGGDLDDALAAVKTYDWGDDRGALAPIDEAVRASHDDPAARKNLEKRLAELLSTDAPRAAKSFVCRKLSLIGTADSVPALAPLVTDKELSHMARYALERMPCPEAAKALRDSLSKTKGLVKVGVINSLGARRDQQSTEVLTALLADSDEKVARAACAALGAIGTPEAAKALGDFQAKAPEPIRLAAADAYLRCAESLLAAGKKLEAMTIYKTLSTSDQPKHVRLAATRGLLAAAGKK